MRGLLKFRNPKERDCATVAERCRVLPPLPSPRFALPCVARLRGNTGWRNSKEGPRNLSDVTRNSTRRCVLRMSDSSVYRRDWRQCSSSAVRVVTTEKSASAIRCIELVTKWIIAAEEYEMSAGKKLMKCHYSEIATVISNCKYRLTIYPINRAEESKIHSLFDALPA
jgi:hypothetical protein